MKEGRGEERGIKDEDRKEGRKTKEGRKMKERRKEGK